MTNEELDRIEAAAKKATPGCDGWFSTIVKTAEWGYVVRNLADNAYIDEMHPGIALRMVERIRELEEELQI